MHFDAKSYCRRRRQEIKEFKQAVFHHALTAVVCFGLLLIPAKMVVTFAQKRAIASSQNEQQMHVNQIAMTR